MGGIPVTPTIQDPNQPKDTLADIIKGLIQGMGNQGGGGGKGSPLISPGMIGQVPQMPGVPQVAGAGGGGMPQMQMPGGQPPRMAAPMGSPSQNTSGSSMPPGNPLFQSGFEYNTPKGRDGAVVASAIQGVTQFLGQAKQKKEAKTKAQAEGYMSQIHAAQQSGDQDALNLLLTDPKVVSTLEKGLDFLMPKVPGEAPPPEAHGIKKFLDKLTGKQQGGTNPNGPRLPQPNTPGGVIQPRAPQSQSNEQAMKDIISKAGLQAFQQDPNLAKQAGTGSALSGQEQRQAELYKNGLAISPEAQAKMSVEDKKLEQQWQMFQKENQTEMKKIASQESIAAARDKTELTAARISAGPAYARAKVAQDSAKALIEYRKKVNAGNQGAANKVALDAWTKEEKDLRDQAIKWKEKNPAVAEKFLKDADSKKDQINDLSKRMTDDPNDPVNQFINQLLNQ